MKMKRIFAVVSALALVISVASCGSKTTPVVSAGDDMVEINQPFAGFTTDADCFRFVGVGVSPDQAAAGKIARLNARTELGSMIETMVKAVTEQYMNQVTVGDKQEYRAKMEENARLAVAQALKGSSQKDSKLFKSKDGRYTAYSAMEMPKKVVEDAVIEVISKDEKTALEFDQFMFKKTFDAEMEKLAAEQAQ